MARHLWITLVAFAVTHAHANCSNFNDCASCASQQFASPPLNCQWCPSRQLCQELPKLDGSKACTEKDGRDECIQSHDNRDQFEHDICCYNSSGFASSSKKCEVRMFLEQKQNMFSDCAPEPYCPFDEHLGLPISIPEKCACNNVSATLTSCSACRQVAQGKKFQSCSQRGHDLGWCPKVGRCMFGDKDGSLNRTCVPDEELGSWLPPSPNCMCQNFSAELPNATVCTAAASHCPNVGWCPSESQCFYGSQVDNKFQVLNHTCLPHADLGVFTHDLACVNPILLDEGTCDHCGYTWCGYQEICQAAAPDSNCSAASFPTNLTGKFHCSGLTQQQNIANESQCVAACCSNVNCGIWHWCPANSTASQCEKPSTCWIDLKGQNGTNTAAACTLPVQPSLRGGGRNAPTSCASSLCPRNSLCATGSSTPRACKPGFYDPKSGCTMRCPANCFDCKSDGSACLSSCAPGWTGFPQCSKLCPSKCRACGGSRLLNATQPHAPQLKKRRALGAGQQFRLLFRLF
eukprot:TRINITY_DN33256_c0_g1_i1.p1 TRINITY_DN33256_c0_g1~~TRINITY_DN33256_c0_g1_i1.p1  ORF type:complete len:518 (-),score=45.39 TRINITY_DN33256_c0_g1_i1:633-2186(-)